MDANLASLDQRALESKWHAGDIMYKDVNGDGVIDGGSGVLGDTGDRSIIGSSSPRYRFSFDINGSYRNFDFRIFLRSEEHTSELQSRGHLVCRLLLEKKNTLEGTTTCNAGL